MAIDPHAWQDPRNGIIYVRNITAGLAEADRANAATYYSVADRYTAAIRQTDEWIAAQFETIPPSRRRIITSHDAFGYYGARFGIEFLAAEGLSTDAEPSGQVLAALVSQIKRMKIHSVFLENMTDPRLAAMLARETGAKLGGTVFSDALSPPGGPASTYLMMLRYNTRLFVDAMRSS
jgi:zinc/manganese transport system substrate-binding protein